MFSTNENERESRKVYLWNSPYLFKFGFAGNTPHFYKEKTNPSIEEKSKAESKVESMMLYCYCFSISYHFGYCGSQVVLGLIIHIPFHSTVHLHPHSVQPQISNCRGGSRDYHIHVNLCSPAGQSWIFLCFKYLGDYSSCNRNSFRINIDLQYHLSMLLMSTCKIAKRHPGISEFDRFHFRLCHKKTEEVDMD